MKKYLLLASTVMLLTACGTKTVPVVTTPETPTPTTENTQMKPETTVQEDKMEATTSAPKETTKPVTPTSNPSTNKSYTATEVAAHSNASSCWLILDAKVYDVTKFIPNHPGGEAILRGCGKDATQMFSRHPASAKAMKEQFYIGDLKQ